MIVNRGDAYAAAIIEPQSIQPFAPAGNRFVVDFCHLNIAGVFVKAIEVMAVILDGFKATATL